jgi:glyoxylase-like metal-dependent hydrolase (beta-lactamase superfamily II)
LVRLDQTEPADVVDRLLWRDAQQILERHAEPDHGGNCEWCGKEWPCAPRRLAERAEVASCRPWNEAWTARHDLSRHDLYSLRTLPSWRVEPGGRSRGGWHRANSNRGLFF